MLSSKLREVLLNIIARLAKNFQIAYHRILHQFVLQKCYLSSSSSVYRVMRSMARSICAK